MRGPKEKQNSRYNKRQLHDICIFRVWQRLVWKWETRQSGKLTQAPEIREIALF